VERSYPAAELAAVREEKLIAQELQERKAKKFS
jgi:hypothetical protein